MVDTPPPLQLVLDGAFLDSYQLHMGSLPPICWFLLQRWGLWFRSPSGSCGLWFDAPVYGQFGHSPPHCLRSFNVQTPVNRRPQPLPGIGSRGGKIPTLLLVHCVVRITPPPVGRSSHYPLVARPWTVAGGG